MPEQLTRAPGAIHFEGTLCYASPAEGWEVSLANAKIAMKQAKLEALLLKELRTITDCKSATSISIYLRRAPDADPNWTLAGWGVGNCPAKKCGDALRAMVARFGELYDAVP